MLLAISFFITPRVSAQQDPQYTQNMFNLFAINPAYAGSQGQVCFSSLYRQQWIGIEDAPLTTEVGIHTPFKLFGAEHGIGLSFNQDNYLGLINKSPALSYTYRFNLGKGKLGLGGRVGYNMYTYNPSAWRYPFDVEKGAASASDPSIPAAGTTPVDFVDYSAGAFYNSEDAYLGLSMTHITSPELKYDGSTATNSAAKTNLLSHIYVSAGYYYQLPSNPLIVIAPSFFMMSYGQGTQLNFNSNVIYNDKIWGGISYRVNDAISALFGFQLYNGLKLGAAYDFNVLSPVGKLSNGSVEFLLSYSFSLKKEKIPRKYKSVRFL